jgi:hypothetical protein
MADFSTKRFDDRILDREDDGSAFERFVDEFLRLQSPDDALVRGLAKGRDGAIDLSDAGGEVTQIAECKFVGAKTDGTASKRWGEVASRLRENLPKVACGSGAEKYRPWLKSEGNLQSYRFVTSAICADVNERNQLRKSIGDFFTAISREHDELNHLQNLEVDVRFWDDLVGQSATFAPLFYRWFGGFPPGYGEIAVSFGSSEVGFKRFLESGNLPYFSRDAYSAQIGKQDISHIEVALEHLTKGNDGRAFVISGPGGIGKTRMSIEICKKALDQGWWPVRLERRARIADLDDLCASHADTARVLLFIDYAEAFDELDQVPEAVFRLARDGQHRISMLASTRSSSIQRVTDQLTEIETGELPLRSEGGHDGYDSWVVRQILDHFNVPNAEAVAASCSGLPVMAAFAGFLFVRDKAKFEDQFGNLVAVNDFGDWATTRLKSVENRFPGHPVQRILAGLAVRLPMPTEEAEAFRAASDINRDLFEVLRADHWLESDGDGFSAAHDVLADAMLARHLAGMPGSEQDRLQNLLGSALVEDRLDRCLAAVDRLGQHPVFTNLSGRRAVEALIERDRSKTLAQFPAVAQRRLVTPADLIELLAGSEELRLGIEKAPQAYLTLARAAEWAATKGCDRIDRPLAENGLSGPLATAVAWPNPSNIILRCAHAFDPARYRDAVFERLLAEPDHIDSHYLIVSLLKSGASPQEVLLCLQAWLVKNERAVKASFAYRSWLDAHGDVDAVRAHVLAWLVEHGSSQEARFVYRSWLGAKGDVEAVRANVVAWLAEHGRSQEAGFVYRSWLDAGGDVEAVRANVVAWLAKHGTITEARFVYKSWIDAAGEVKAVRANVVAWVAEHGTITEAEFLYSSWLDAHGDVEAVRANVVAWLAEHGTSQEAGFVYRSWLDAKGDEEAVRANVVAWLAEHGTIPEAGFVYKSWLEAKGDVDAVRAHVFAWLAKHGTIPEARFVYQSWLDAGEPFESIRSSCERWLKEHWDLEDAGFVTKALSSREDLSFDSIARIVAWAGTHARHEDAIFRLSRVSRSFVLQPSNSGFRKLVTKATRVVFDNLLEKEALSGHEKDACSILFANFAKNEYPRDDNWPTIVGIFQDGLKHGGVFTQFAGMPRMTWAVLLAAALERQLLDWSVDGAAISHAVDLILQAISEHELNELISSGYFGEWPGDRLDLAFPESQ